MISGFARQESGICLFTHSFGSFALVVFAVLATRWPELAPAR